MTFVCNAGPVIALAKVDHLGLLRELADQVMIPERVLHEVLAKPGRDADRIVYAVRDFLEVRNPPLDLDAKVREASIQLDAGERDVVALAATTAHPVTAILDDAAGRRAATHLGIPVLGFIGLVLIAKNNNESPR